MSMDSSVSSPPLLESRPGSGADRSDSEGPDVGAADESGEDDEAGVRGASAISISSSSQCDGEPGA